MWRGLCFIERNKREKESEEKRGKKEREKEGSREAARSVSPGECDCMRPRSPLSRFTGARVRIPQAQRDG